MTTASMSSRLIPASERLFASNPPLGPNIFDAPSPVSNRTILPLLLTTNELSSIFISDGFMKLSVSSLRTSSFGTPRNEFRWLLSLPLRSRRRAPSGFPLGEHHARQYQEQLARHPPCGRRQTSAALPRCFRLAFQPTLCPEINPRATRHRGDDNAAHALPPPQIG